MPDSRPGLQFDEHGLCNACLNYANRTHVDWNSRQRELEKILERYRSADGSNWDCIIPVSGGKDSTYQVLRMLQLGMNPLCVTSTTCDLSELGRKNIENIKNLGVDYIEFTSNPVVRRKINRITLTRLGDISWPEHAGIFSIPVRAAVQFNIPLIIWGENSQNEYGGPASEETDNVLTRHWLKAMNVLKGIEVADLVGMDGIKQHHLLPFLYPSDEDLQRVGVTGIFLGYYMPWDGFSNALIAQANGFTVLPHVVEGSCVNYENLDNHQIGIHDYFMFLKYGFGRATDIACLHLRRGRLTRRDAIDLVKKHDGKFPWSYLDKSLHDILKPLDITIDEFIEICDRFTNKDLFETDASGNLVKDKNGNLRKKVYPQ